MLHRPVIILLLTLVISRVLFLVPSVSWCTRYPRNADYVQRIFQTRLIPSNKHIAYVSNVKVDNIKSDENQVVKAAIQQKSTKTVLVGNTETVEASNLAANNKIKVESTGVNIVANENTPKLITDVPAASSSSSTSQINEKIISRRLDEELDDSKQAPNNFRLLKWTDTEESGNTVVKKPDAETFDTILERLSLIYKDLKRWLIELGEPPDIFLSEANNFVFPITSYYI